MSATPGVKTCLLKQTKTQYQPTNSFHNRQKNQHEFTKHQFANNQGGKFQHYHSSGSGRDSFVTRNNGGFTAMYENVKWPGVGSIQGRPAFKKAPPNPVCDAKTIFYRNDGTGRDSYIGTSSGGNFHYLKPQGSNYEFKELFKANLRDYQKAVTKHNTPRAIFSAIPQQRQGVEPVPQKKFTNELQRAQDKVFADNQLRRSLNIQTFNTLEENGMMNTFDQRKDTQESPRLGKKSISNTKRNMVSQSLTSPETIRVGRQKGERQSYNEQSLSPSARIDVLCNAQNTYPQPFVIAQTQFGNYQRVADSRLSLPKHQRRRLIGFRNGNGKPGTSDGSPSSQRIGVSQSFSFHKPSHGMKWKQITEDYQMFTDDQTPRILNQSAASAMPPAVVVADKHVSVPGSKDASQISKRSARSNLSRKLDVISQERRSVHNSTVNSKF